jgi:SAM-dependent methyltransferase
MMHSTREAINAANASFWDELCGSSAARAWGITDSSVDSLRRYDDNFFTFYPYLDRHIDWQSMRDKRVLEVGLGYGSVSQKLAESGALFTGLDVAANPVLMVNHRLEQNGLRGTAVQGTILDPPFRESSFDVIVAIGCLHHTGNLPAAIESCWRLLAPAGRLIGMVYYAFSYRQMWIEPRRTFRHLLQELAGHPGTVRDGNTFGYDHASDGSLAPSTEFVSIKSLRSFCCGFADFHARLENAAGEPPFVGWTRDQLLSSPLPQICGLDLYWTCVKLKEDCPAS